MNERGQRPVPNPQGKTPAPRRAEPRTRASRFSIWRGTIGLLFVAWLSMHVGCAQFGSQPRTTSAEDAQPADGGIAARTTEAIGRTRGKAGEFLGSIEPTGLLSTAQHLEEAAKHQAAAVESYSTKLEQMDVERLNETIATLGDTSTTLRERLAAIAPDDVDATFANLRSAAENLNRQLSQADITRTTNSAISLAETADAKLKALDPHRVNDVLIDSQKTIAQLQQAIEKLSQRVDTTGDDTTALLASTRETLASLPVDELRATLTELTATTRALRESTGQVPAVTANVLSITESLKFVVWAFLGLTALAAACLIVWLVQKLTARRQRPDTRD